MLRITPLVAREKAILRLEGKLRGPWVDVLAKVWRGVWHRTGLKRIRVDLRALSFVDERGKDVLMAMRQDGAEFVATDPLISALLEEIERNRQSLAGSSQQQLNKPGVAGADVLGKSI
jgi:anti-anti-sigma regulatory factor